MYILFFLLIFSNCPQGEIFWGILLAFIYKFKWAEPQAALLFLSLASLTRLAPCKAPFPAASPHTSSQRFWAPFQAASTLILYLKFFSAPFKIASAPLFYFPEFGEKCTLQCYSKKVLSVAYRITTWGKLGRLFGPSHILPSKDFQDLGYNQICYMFFRPWFNLEYQIGHLASD
jgi:hypothetical protein